MFARRARPALVGFLALILAAPAGFAHSSHDRSDDSPRGHGSKRHAAVPHVPPPWQVDYQAALACHVDEYPWLGRLLERWSASPSRHRHGHRPAPPPAWGLMRLLVAFLGECPAEPPAQPPPDLPAGASLLDANGTAAAEIGAVDLHATAPDVGGADTSVGIGADLVDPVVILGPPSAHDSDPGVARVSDVAADRFSAGFQEWPYLDGVHAAETAAFLVVSSGRHTFADGSVWEAGTFDQDGASGFVGHSFASAFPSAPLVFLTVQTRNDDQPVVVRARAVDAAGFEAALFAEEAATAAHASEHVGYLAVWSPPQSGRLASDTGSLPYLARQVTAGDQHVPFLSHTVWLEEEASADAEVAHPDETLDALAIGPRLFAQETSSADPDTVAPRMAPPELEVAVEWGTLPGLHEEWQTVPLARTYTHPVVVVRPLSSVGEDPAVARVRNVTSDSFDVRVQEWEYLDGVHADERTFYLVAEQGVQALAGLVVEAGTLDTGRVLSEGTESVAFSAPFADVPAVFGASMTDNGPEAVTLRVGNRSATGFDLALQEEEADTDGHAVESVGWIAMERGRGVTTDGRVVKVFDSSTVPSVQIIPFGEVLSGRFPVLVGQVSSIVGTDTVELRYTSLNPDGAVLYLQEEQSLDSEMNHAAEETSLFVAE